MSDDADSPLQKYDVFSAEVLNTAKRGECLEDFLAESVEEGPHFEHLCHEEIRCQLVGAFHNTFWLIKPG